MTEEASEEEEEEVPEQLTPGALARQNLVLGESGDSDPSYRVGAFDLPAPGGEADSVPIICISEVDSQLLVAVPSHAWHRTVSSRVLPPRALFKPVLVSFAAVLNSDRHTILPDITIKAWLAYLRPEFERCLDFETPESEVLPFSSEEGLSEVLPAAEALVQIAEDKFNFLSAASGGAEEPEGTAHRLARLEESVIAMRSSLVDLAKQQQPPATAPLFKPTAKPGPRSPKTNAPKSSEIHYIRRWVARFGSSSGCSCFECRHREDTLTGVCSYDAAEEEGFARPASCSSRESREEAAKSTRGVRGGGRTRGSCSRGSSVRAHDCCLAEVDKDCGSIERSKTQKGKVVGRCIGRSRSEWRQFQFQHQQLELKEERPGATGVEEGPEGVPPRALRSYEAADVRRLWVARGCSRFWRPSSYISRMGRTSQSDTKSQRYGSYRVGSGWSVGQSGSRSGRRSQSSPPVVSGESGSSCHRPWVLGTCQCGVVGRCPSFCQFWQACPAGFPRASTQQTLASSLGGCVYAPDPRARRVSGSEVKARQTAGGRKSECRTVGWRGKRLEREERKVERSIQRGQFRSGRRRVFKQSVNDIEEEVQQALPPPQSLHDSVGQHQGPPGSRASTVHAHTWWTSSFRLLRRFGGAFSEFVRSFHRKPAILRDEGTAVLWPMPLPYPAELISTNSARANSFRRGVNLAVAALNWLHLRRPRTCPAEIVLFRKLTKLQWKVVRFIESALTAWDVSEPITATGMGRAASKVEDIEILLARLSSFETGLDSVMEELETRNSNDLGHKSFCSFAPGLQAESAGELVGQLPGRQLSVAKTIEADRIDFRGTPEFDAAPFLDPLGRALYLDPVSQAIRPVEPPPVKIFASETEKWKLLRKLDASGRLGAILEGEVYQGYQTGLFSIQKDGSKDRLIFDSRPFNTLEQVPQRWIKSMASAATLCELQLGKDEICLVSGTDLREFYYSFRATHSRLVRNSLLVTVWPWELRGFKCYRPALERQRRKVYLGLRTLAMGDSAAVELAQTAHVGLLAQSGLLSFENLLCMELPPPRSVSMVGVVIDDLVLFERLVVSQLDSGVKPQTEAMLQKAISRYTNLGLIPHSGKTFALKEEEEFWGCLFEGRRGMVRASLRVIPILFATLGVLKLGVTTLQLLEVLTGCWVSIFLFKRRMLSLLNTCYTALGSGEDRRSVLRLSDALRDELLLCCMLAPLAVTCLKAENADFVYASDASDWGYAVVRAPLRGWMRGELHRHRLRKSTWVRLLSPYKAHLRRRGELDAAEELPGGKPLSSHPLWSKLASCLQFDTVVKRQLRENIHINVGELNGMVAAEREAVRDKLSSSEMF